MEEKNPFIQDDKKALLGAANGIFLYDLFWPYLVVIIFQLLLGDHYASLVTSNYYSFSLILMIISGLLTLTVGILIAKPKNVINSIKKIHKEDIKTIILILTTMIFFTLAYNLTITLFGINASGGNANQGNVVELVYGAPILAFIYMIILAPTLEELTYRYFVYGGIAKYNRKWAIVLSGFIFMCVHASASFTQNVDNVFRELMLLPPYMFSGMALAYAYDKKANLLIPIIIHSLNNLFSFIVCFL